MVHFAWEWFVLWDGGIGGCHFLRLVEIKMEVLMMCKFICVCLFGVYSSPTTCLDLVLSVGINPGLTGQDKGMFG